jgi:hypothetical protein
MSTEEFQDEDGFVMAMTEPEPEMQVEITNVNYEVSEAAVDVDEPVESPETVSIMLAQRVIGQLVDNGVRFKNGVTREVSAEQAERLLAITRNGQPLYVRTDS